MTHAIVLSEAERAAMPSLGSTLAGLEGVRECHDVDVCETCLMQDFAQRPFRVPRLVRVEIDARRLDLPAKTIEDVVNRDRAGG